MINAREKTTAAALAVLLAVSMLAGCSDPSEQESSRSQEQNGWHSADYDADYLMEGAIPVRFTGDGVDCDDSGVRIDGSMLEIVSGGVYYLTGSWNSGQILINASEEETVQLVLADVLLTGKGEAVIFAEQADRVILTLAANTENSISDTAVSDAGAPPDSAAVYSKVDLLVNGAGTLELSGNRRNGITTEHRLEISGGSLMVAAREHAVLGKSSVTITDSPALVLDAGENGICTEDPSGSIELYGGMLDITALGDAIHSAGSLNIRGGAYTLTSGRSTGDKQEDEYPVRKGLSAGEALTIESGTFQMECADEAISGASVTISGGDFLILAGDAAVHARYSMTISGGTLTADATVGLEASNLTVNGGHLSLISRQYGININSSLRSGQRYLSVNGGFVSCQTDQTALEINGNLQLTGGTVILNGNPDTEKALFRCSGITEFDGGTLVAAGGSGEIILTAAASSTQPALIVSFDQIQPEERLVHLQKTTGREIVTFSPVYSYHGLLISSPLMIDGESCLLYTGGTAGGAQVSGLYSDTTYTPGDVAAEIPLTGTVTRYTVNTETAAYN